jgi:hypothetical protein
MKDDPIWRGWLLISVLVFLVVALYPGLAIKVLSYGRKTTQDIDRRLLVTTRLLAVVAVIYGVAYLAWGVIQK